MTDEQRRLMHMLVDELAAIHDDEGALAFVDKYPPGSPGMLALMAFAGTWGHLAGAICRSDPSQIEEMRASAMASALSAIPTAREDA